jgi:hypothetical protein
VKPVRVALLALGLTVAAPGSAGAVLDPSRAEVDAAEAIRGGAYTFCREPREPLSRRALALCPHAAEIPGCEGFAAACAKTTPASPSRAPSWGGPLVGLPAILGSLAQATVWLLVAALFLAVLVPIVRALSKLRREDRKEPEAAPAPVATEASAVVLSPSLDEEVLLQRAAELARAGDNAAALQLYLFASLRALDKRGALRVAAHRTNGEYVRACSDAGAKAALYRIVREVDRVQFGGEPAGAEAVARAAERAFAIVRSLPVALLAMAVALGCGGASRGSPRPGDDPAGQELFEQVLRRQGVRVEALGQSLASMPLPSEHHAPAVVVDVSRTPLDDDTSAHLVEWVAAGGVLVLAGSPADWPRDFHAARAAATGDRRVTARVLLARNVGDDDGDDDGASEPDGPVYAQATEHAELASAEALTLRDAVDRAATFPDGSIYAAVLAHGQGYVLGIATDELLTNAALAREKNAAAMIAIFSNADRLSFSIAQQDDGVAPPSTPLAALLRAGLGLALVHALVASLLLFLAVGIRLARPRPAAPPARRAFAEHVEAVGALYARTHSAPHALATYATFADERLRARMPRSSGDVATFLAARARLPLEQCQRLWSRAMAAKTGAPPRSDELAVLRELTAAYSAAMAKDK